MKLRVVKINKKTGCIRFCSLPPNDWKFTSGPGDDATLNKLEVGDVYEIKGMSDFKCESQPMNDEVTTKITFHVTKE